MSGPLDVWETAQQRPTVPQQLERVWRWSLWDYADASKLAKVIIGVPPHRYTTRDEARRALGYQHRADAAGHMYARAGIALSVNPADVQRLAPWLEGIEVFIDPGLDDLPIVLPSDTNGVVPVPPREIPEAGPPSWSRGLRLPDAIWEVLDEQSTASGMSVSRMITELVQQAFDSKTPHDRSPGASETVIEGTNLDPTLSEDTHHGTRSD